MPKTTTVWRVIEAWLDQVQFPPTQSKIAQTVGVQRSAVSDWKWGKSRPTPEHLEKLGDMMAPAIGPVAYEQLLIALLIDLGYDVPEKSVKALGMDVGWMPDITYETAEGEVRHLEVKRAARKQPGRTRGQLERDQPHAD